jgi:hypothetical protein
VKQPVRLVHVAAVSRESFPDTKLGEDHVQQVLNIDAPCDPSKRLARAPQVLCLYIKPRMGEIKSVKNALPSSL